MKKPLIIVESPTKARTIKKFLPSRYVVKASVGHVRDLPKSTLGVDVENDFAPKYLTIKGKGDIIKDLRVALKNASEVYLATDPDREGEAIAWHLAELLKLPDPKRIELHEITKDAAMTALKHPHHIDLDRVNAQQARRILDRLVGYKISPLLWAKVRGGLSAGRVQSVAVKLIVDREREITSFVPREYWSITALLSSENEPESVFAAELISRDGEKFEATSRETADEVLAAVAGASYRIASVKQRETRRNAPAPFTTSTLQQEASRKLRLRVRRTMQLAQALYEGVDLGSEGTQGLITYMRTDSTRISDTAREGAREFIVQSFGEPYYGGRGFKVRAGAQDAHEAIRPTAIARSPASLAGILKREELRLYTLIWERFVASQMAAAVFDQTTVDIVANRYTFRANGSVLKFAGFTKVYQEGKDDDTVAAARKGNAPTEGKGRVLLPRLEQDEILRFHRLDPKQHFTEPPPRYSEATLVKTLEENGIGRPSTYSAIVETIQARQYVQQTERRFHPTQIGVAVNDLLNEHFGDIMDLEFTASMETKLDRIAVCDAGWVEVLRQFYLPFIKELNVAEAKLPRVEIKDEPTDAICPNCGRPMVIKSGRFGRFISCSGYPECKTTAPILKDTGAKCPKDGGMIVERKSRKGRVFFGCANYPKCDFISWDRVVPAPCLVCGAYVVSKVRRGGVASLECSNNKEHDNASLNANSSDSNVQEA
ncbi:MAG: type I DNA topoisomerase [Candidatus Eremiobacteraeota bacterium]|nr:type I DNA topoisomerase [Candidatus Eremiobacteraeota bacterium]